MTKVLEGVRIIEIGTMITAPLAGMMLADLGADVIKIEQPKGGDPFRHFSGELYSPHFTAYNRNKRSVELDLRTPEGKAAFDRLAETADILIENFRPGVMNRLGLSWSAMKTSNAGLIYCSISGFGATGPYCERPAYDAVASALGGLTGLILDPDRPRMSGPTIADNVTGMYAAYGILGALNERHRTGVGRRVEVNMLEAAMAFIPDPFANHTLSNLPNGPETRVATSQSFAFVCADSRLLAIHLSSPEKFWRGLLQALERPELGNDERFATRDARVRNYSELRVVLSTIIASRPLCEWSVRLEECDVPFAPVQTIPEVLEDPQVIHLGSFYETVHPTYGSIVGIRRPVSIDGSREIDVRAPPALGEHTDEVLRSLGYDEDHLAAFHRASA